MQENITTHNGSGITWGKWKNLYVAVQLETAQTATLWVIEQEYDFKKDSRLGESVPVVDPCVTLRKGVPLGEIYLFQYYDDLIGELKATEAAKEDRRGIFCFDRWICHWNFGKLFELINHFEPPLFWRIKGDVRSVYGDGGESNLAYPVYVCENLPISESTRKYLVDSLLALSELKKDKHPNEPVEDIIDPDLAPARIPTPRWNQFLRALLKKQEEEILSHSSTYPSDVFLERDEEEPLPPKNIHPYYNRRKIRHPNVASLSQGTKYRASYHWIPTNVVIQSLTDSSKANGSPLRTCNITSPIHNLPLNKANKKLYKAISKVFTACLPGLENLKLINKEGDTKLQVIIKAQSYPIPPGSTYSGKWHIEGLTEKIVAAIVYYCDIDEGFEGGALKFRPPHAPQKFFVSPDRVDAVVPVATGTAVVFSNDIPHRFRLIRNSTNSTLRRTFLNFFIVDPTNPLPSTTECISIDESLQILTKASTLLLGHPFPPEIQRRILAFADMWPSWEVARRFRDLTKREMGEIKAGWGWVNYGNAGVQKFINNFEIWEERISFDFYGNDGVHHTKSTDSDEKSN